ncbi:hypothetical protein R1flu_010965 [Riccia fluitans]|uniref:Uncharacterized protein n=1 Tax=Riccia fluitans TaxID=41844 RepID=A0ABD1Z6G8_9MARC
MAVEGQALDEESRALLQAQDADSGVESGHGCIWRWALLFSLLLNFHLWMGSYSSCSLDPAEVSLKLLNKSAKMESTSKEWAHPAAVTAETLAAYDCSGRGSVFIDSVQLSDDPNEMVCECHACFTGSNCEEPIPDCVAFVDSGDPVLYEEFWKQNAEAGTLVTPPCVVQTHLGQSDEPSAVVGAYPVFPLYQMQTSEFGNGMYRWGGDARTFDQQVENPKTKTVELVTHPNNPDFLPRHSLLNRSNSYPVFDFAYYWPHMQPISHKFDEDIMVFTLSKLTGHAGTRLGWAFFRDPELALAVTTTLSSSDLGLSHDTIGKATQLLKTVIAGYSKDRMPVPFNLPAAEYAKEGRIFHYGRAVLSKRYKWLVDILSLSSRFSIGRHEPEFSPFFGQMVDPSPAYAWVSCNRDEDEDCYSVFLNNGIKTYPGQRFGASSRYVRFSLLTRDSDYEILEKHLLKLVGEQTIPGN